MEEYLECRIKAWKQIAFERVTASQAVCLGPCFLFSASIHSDGGGEADADVYNGENTNEVRILDLYCVDEAMDQLNFNPPIFCERGLYVDIGTNCESVGIQFLPVK